MGSGELWPRLNLTIAESILPHADEVIHQAPPGALTAAATGGKIG